MEKLAQVIPAYHAEAPHTPALFTTAAQIVYDQIKSIEIEDKTITVDLQTHLSDKVSAADQKAIETALLNSPEQALEV